jgi:PAS domain S-box-containing protein
MKLAYVVLLMVAILSNSILLYILLRHKHRSQTLIPFTFFIALINIWAIPQFILNLQLVDVVFFRYLDKISSFGYILIPPTFLVFALSFVGKLHFLKSYLRSILIFLPAVGFLYLSWTTILIDNSSKFIRYEWGFSSPPGSLFSFFILWFETVMILSLFIIFRYYRKNVDRIRKIQSIWLMSAILIPLSIGSITDAFLPIFNIILFPSAVPLTSIMALLIAYAIFKYELFVPSPLTILSSISEGVITVDKYGKVVLINDAASKMLGKKEELIVGKQFNNVLNLKSQKGVLLSENENPIKKSLSWGKKISTNDFLVSSAKKSFPISLSASPVYSENERIGVTITLKDITKEKEIEKEKDDFISIASHELKTPITSMRLFSQLLQRNIPSSSDKKVKSYLKNFDDQLQKLAKLTANLLDLSRIRSGKFELLAVDFKINELIREIILNVKKTNPQIKIEHKFTQDILVHADKDKISEVLLNLLSNAINYAPASKRIVVNVIKEGKWVVVSVQDFGRGIPLNMQKKIFRRYFRASSTVQLTAGLGLGLYISSSIIRQHKGKIWVKSRIGKGSIFSFSLPAH